MRPTKVLSIVGAGRSGTTIVANVLGEVDGVCNVGELRWLWRRGLMERYRYPLGGPTVRPERARSGVEALRRPAGRTPAPTPVDEGPRPYSLGHGRP